MASEKQRKLMFAKAHQAGLEIDWKECIQWEQDVIKAFVDKCDAVISGEVAKPFNAVEAKAPVEEKVVTDTVNKVPDSNMKAEFNFDRPSRNDWVAVRDKLLHERHQLMIEIDLIEAKIGRVNDALHSFPPEKNPCNMTSTEVIPGEV